MPEPRGDDPVNRPVLLRYHAALQYELRLQEAREDFLTFCEMMMPGADPNDPYDTGFHAAEHHRFMAELVHRVINGQVLDAIINIPPRHGKLVADDTPIWTPIGWRKHGDLQPGDQVFGPDGQPCRVVAVSPPDVADHVVTTTDGAEIWCHGNHEWTVHPRNGAAITVETRWLLEPNRVTRRKGLPRPLWYGERGARGCKAIYRLPPVAALAGGERHLPIHPYAFGAWLGDGSSSKAAITMCAEDLPVVQAEFERIGHPFGAIWTHQTTGVLTASLANGPSGKGKPSPFKAALVSLGVLGRKRIPEAYLTASVAQRLDLLAGLMDTDGHVEADTGRCRIVTASPDLAADIQHLCRTLGFRAGIHIAEPATSTSGIEGKSLIYTVGFNPSVRVPCRLPRKASQRVLEGRRSIAIADVRKCGAGEAKIGRCIQVDRPDGLYLVGEHLTPTHNSHMMTWHFAAWFSGRNPDKDVMVAAYNKDFAEGEHSSKTHDILRSQRFRQVFPTYGLNPKQNSGGHRQTNAGGNLYFVGRQSSTTGKGGDLILVDDPMRDAKEAKSEVIREDIWDWFRRTLYTRKHNSRAPMIVTQTRWTADDLVGRISDPANLHYSPEFGSVFEIINLPALAIKDHDLVGRMQGEALWPEKFDTDALKRLQAVDPVGFSCLYQGNPVPDEGVIFQPDDLPEYSREELRQIEDRLVIYVFSDHAYGTTKHHDPSCFAPVGIAPNGDAYFLPDLFWDRVSPDDAVERAIEMIQRRRPMEWIAENHHIFKGIEPFLKKRMTETGAIVPITAVWPKGKTGKADRAVGAHGRCRMGKIKFPGFASWWPRARAELLAFPNGNNDDFVDVLSLLGLQLDRICQRGARVQRKEVEVGTYDWWFRDEERRGINTFGRTGRAV